MANTDIEGHRVIGKLRTTALVCTNGTIDFFCYPRVSTTRRADASVFSSRGWPAVCHLQPFGYALMRLAPGGIPAPLSCIRQ